MRHLTGRSIGLLLSASLAASASRPVLSGLEVMRRVNARNPGTHCRLEMRMELRDLHDGQIFVRDLEMLRQATPTGYRTRYRVIGPERYREISLLLLEDLRPPEMWLFFPASGHRAQVGSRGLSALGSDFSCEELKALFDVDAFELRNLGGETRDGTPHLRIEMVPRSPGLKRELGYARAIGIVRTNPWMVVEADYFDAEGRLLRSFRATDIRRANGVWIARRFSMENARVGNRTEVEVKAADCRSPVREEDVDLGHLGSP
ncbi:MAG TPA: outer membrane lipoprotein-sorting protein [Thermoanaerobaculia bacterium]|nr:outer membrane lipoprotein-sorting protein [Thermoanaerobaculia bacterium]